MIMKYSKEPIPSVFLWADTVPLSLTGGALRGQSSALSLYKQHRLYLDLSPSVLTFLNSSSRLLAALSTYFSPLGKRRKNDRKKCHNEHPNRKG